MTDSVRGANKPVIVYTNSERMSRLIPEKVNAFNFNGFATGTDTMLTLVTNNFTAMCFKAGGNKNTFNIDDVGYSSVCGDNMRCWCSE